MSRILSMGLLIAVWAVAQTTPNFSGIWEINPSKTPDAAKMPGAMRGKIDHQGTAFAVTIRLVSNGATQQEKQIYLIGEESKNQMHGAPMTSRAEWDGTALVVQSVARFGNKELRLSDRWTLSADGNTLTLRERHQFGTEPEAEDVRVFDRKPASSWEQDAPPKLAEEVYKNIQIMKGVPAPRIQPVMVNLARWLGVECAHCHVPGQFESDEKPAKETARKMFMMVRAINRDNFPSGSVTCWTCHRGKARPETLPLE